MRIEQLKTVLVEIRYMKWVKNSQIGNNDTSVDGYKWARADKVGACRVENINMSMNRTEPD